ncbi:hypothetical protein E2562_017495 [Oryza meyeriana var. granulata]|uniref:Wall-associated receptor kinase galacturonan-binding domain-containing protein n=1 Tax=Oryza meyeriana var. granulata TaxID=110450 RepID=A0A6G1DXU1_9ORYZ|nr:hypothetical protein E2562_017495 [Oryza meyeriana var. granulata]
MHLVGGLLLLCVHLLLILLDGALSATASGHGCQRRCGGLDVPYPFGFSDSCPILLSCNKSNSTAALLRPTNATSSAEPYTVIGKSFNSTASSFLVSLPTSCNRAVSDAKAVATWHLTSPTLFSTSLHWISLSWRAPMTYASEDADCSASILPASQPRLTHCSQIRFRPPWGRP